MQLRASEMELDGGILKPLIDTSKPFSESGHGSPYSVHENFANSETTSCDGNGILSPNSPNAQANEANNATKTKAGLARLLKGKESEWAAVIAKKKGSLRLLDLPMDVLKEIVKEVTHTNDLASLALTHSALHYLAIPHIYARFDIVWPDAHNTAEPRTGVDALTYGLATLVMNEEVFGGAQLHKYSATGGYCQKCTCDQCQSVKSSAAAATQRAKRMRRGNYFSQFTRKFSLGNGPPDWVQEYLITKEGGKMLGTLVALAIARMPNLETFVWDMPTGILRDVWVSLASLNERGNGQTSRLEKLWIRFHDNHGTLSEVGLTQPTAVPQPAQSSLGIMPNSQALAPHNDIGETSVPTLLELSYRRTEHPNFSILSPLKSLSVLDIDEPAYLDEVSTLVEKSIDTLRELRIGIASAASVSEWASLASVVEYTWSSEHANEGSIATGGVFGMIMRKIHNRYTRNHPHQFLQNTEVPPKSSVTADQEVQHASIIDSSWPISDPLQTLSTTPEAIPVAAIVEGVEGVLVDAPMSIGDSELIKPLQPLLVQAPPSREILPDAKTNQQEKSPLEQLENSRDQHSTRSIPQSTTVPKPKRLQLEIFEMERIVMDVKVFQDTIDWSIISTLTLLQCGLHEQLWKALRKTYTPRPVSSATSPSSHSISKRLSSQPSLRSISQHLSRPSGSGFRSSAPDLPSSLSPIYRLNLKRIHTDTVSPALISFLKETLAPNSLEWIFLQDGREYNSPVTINSIFRGPLRRHRGSLTKVMVDSAIGNPDNAHNAKRKKWMFPRGLLAFITSGKMKCLKELAMAVDYKDWHFFVQRLPQIPHLRSLYVPYIANHVYGHQELALQLVDVVAIRPEIELCYMGFSTTCYELLENRHLDEPSWSRFDTSTGPAHTGPGGVDVTDEDSDDEEDSNEDDEVNNFSPAVDPALEDPEDSESDLADGSTEDSDEDISALEKQRPTLKLREILFYDDKVSIFKARHGRL